MLSLYVEICVGSLLSCVELGVFYSLAINLLAEKERVDCFTELVMWLSEFFVFFLRCRVGLKSVIVIFSGQKGH